MKIRVHKGCGGRIVKGKCRKCGEPFSKLGLWFGRDVRRTVIDDTPKKEEQFSAREYRRRIRDGKDIPRGGKD